MPAAPLTLPHPLTAADLSKPSYVKDVLTNVVQPLFIATPHPRLHTETARVLARPANSQDLYHQPWRHHPGGLDEVIRWCILDTQVYFASWLLRQLTMVP